MLNKRYILPLVAVLLLAAMLGPQLLATAAPAPAGVVAAPLAAGKTYIDWAVIKHLTVQSGGIETSSNLDMGTYIISNIGNAATDFDTAGGLTLAGALTTNGGTDLNAATLTIDADADTTLAAVTDDQALLTLGVATGFFQVTTGNLRVGNHAVSAYALNGEDAYIEGTLEVDGNTNLVALYANTLGVTGTTTLAGALDSNGNVGTSGNLSVDGTLKVTSTSDLRGDVSDSAGILTLADSVDVSSVFRAAGAAIFNSTVAITGVTTMGGALDLNSNLGMTGNASIGGTLAVTSTSDLRGAVSNSTGILSLNDSVDVGSVARFAGAAIFNSTIGVTGTVTLGGVLDANSNVGIAGWTRIDGALGVTGTTTLNGALDATNIGASGYTRIDGALGVTGTATFDGRVSLGSVAHFTPTYTVNTPSTWMLVPSASYYSIGSGGAVTMTLAITNVVDGQYLVIYGEDANTVTINDINLLSVGGSTLNLTQYDIGVFIYIGAVSKWAQISLAANS